MHFITSSDETVHILVQTNSEAQLIEMLIGSILNDVPIQVYHIDDDGICVENTDLIPATKVALTQLSTQHYLQTYGCHPN